eukprot:594359-Pelagomonas_calceolata.AAC.5
MRGRKQHHADDLFATLESALAAVPAAEAGLGHSQAAKTHTLHTIPGKVECGARRTVAGLLAEAVHLHNGVSTGCCAGCFRKVAMYMLPLQAAFLRCKYHAAALEQALASVPAAFARLPCTYSCHKLHPWRGGCVTPLMWLLRRLLMQAYSTQGFV